MKTCFIFERYGQISYIVKIQSYIKIKIKILFFYSILSENIFYPCKFFYVFNRYKKWIGVIFYFISIMFFFLFFSNNCNIHRFIKQEV